jgi:leucyl-tRNA synthetase
VRLIAPMMPHLAEECWTVLGRTDLCAEQKWPEIDPALLVVDEVVLPVQLNGKKRGDLTVSIKAGKAEIEGAVMALDFVQAALEGRVPKRIVVVPGRIVNVVV